MKIGIDYHGVLDKYPKFFKVFIESMRAKDNLIYIITGAPMSDFTQDPSVRGITYDYFYSITDDLISTSIPYEIDEKGHNKFDDALWNTAKALYCSKNEIDMMIDDSEIYGKFFVTPYIQFKEIKHELIHENHTSP